jgi:hypothetical protein
MPAILALDEEECYLAALMDDPSGIDLAEAFWTDDTPGRSHRRYRLWDFQYALYWCEEIFQADKMARSLGKSAGIIMRACAFPLAFPGQEMLITAPELNHLSPVVDKVEEKIKAIRLLREMLPKIKGGGIRHQPQFQASFVNGSRIMGRLPQRTGVGVKGCLAAGGLVLTRRGQVPIENVVVGDEVLTHMGRWKPVEHIVVDTAPCVTVSGGGHRGLVMSDNHRMRVRYNRNPSGVKNLGHETWATPDNLEQAHYGSPTRFPSEPIPDGLSNPDLLWVIGRYVADGFLAFQEKRGIQTSARLHIITDAPRYEAVMDRMRDAGLRPTARRRDHNGTYDIEVSDTALCRLVQEHFGELAQFKRLPVWLLGASGSQRSWFLDGYLSGDGGWDKTRSRWVAGTASKELAIGIRLLGQSLGSAGSYSWVDPKVSQVCGRTLITTPRRSHRVTLSEKPRCFFTERGVQWSKVHRVDPAPEQTVYDLVVADDQSFVVDGLISHNQHPLVLEQEESQDYPGPGWIELIETMKHGIPGAQWRAHGVSNGVRDTYHRITSGEDVDSDMPFYVHQYPAMYRPTWSAEERKQKISIYGGSRDNPDYKRNIYGEAGSVSDKVFVLARLMACVRINESSWATDYNENVYACIKIEGESLEGRPIESLINLPASHLHKSYSSYWAGMDLGFTNDPSELLIFGVIRQKRGGEEVDVLRLLARIHLMRVSAVDQEKVIAKVFEFYGLRLRALSMDKSGNGLPVWQHMDKDPTHAKIRDRIKGYGFSEKKAVEFDDRPLVGKETPEDAVIEKNIIEFATDKLREFVDAGEVELPYDKDLLTEFQGQVVVYSRESNGSGGRRKRYGGGSFHTLDAAKVMILGKELEAIELALAPKRRGPVLDAFVG